LQLQVGTLGGRKYTEDHGGHQGHPNADQSYEAAAQALPTIRIISFMEAWAFSILVPSK
jgi:hypothetical protein